MTTFTLGQQVRISDYLLRVFVSARQIMQLAEQGVTVPEAMLKNARREHEHIQKSASAWPVHYPQYRLWLPQSANQANIHSSWVESRVDRQGRTGWLRTDNKHHGYPTDLPTPLNGIIAGKRTLSDGTPLYEEYGTDFDPMGTRTAYQVAYRLDRKPLNVWPEMVESI